MHGAVVVQGDRRVLAARPSDAIALVLRARGAEIYVTEAVLAAMGVRSTDN